MFAILQLSFQLDSRPFVFSSHFEKLSSPTTFLRSACVSNEVDGVWNVMAHAQKPDFIFRRNGRVHLNRRGRQFSPLLAAEVCASAVVMLDTPCSEVVWRVLATHSIRHFPFHFPFRASPCVITFHLDSTCTRKSHPLLSIIVIPWSCIFKINKSLCQ